MPRPASIRILAAFAALCSLPLVAADPPAWVEELREAVAVELAADAPPAAVPLPAVDLRAEYDPGAGTVTGTMRVALWVGEGEAWDGIGFALHANDAVAYPGCGVRIDAARVGGEECEFAMVDDGRGVVLRHDPDPGSWVDCRLEFVTTVSAGKGRAGLLARHADGHNLYSWLPEPAVWDGGWRFPSLPVMSDPARVRMADYRCLLAVPDGWTLVAGGAEERLEDGTWRILLPRGRNLVWWLSDAEVRTLTLEGSGPDVGVAFTGERTINAAFCASVARETLAIASEVIGPYPRRSYDIVFTEFTASVGGMEASGMTFVDRRLLDALDRRRRDPLRDEGREVLSAVIHEALHSWWYGQVGNDTLAEAWIDEPLTEWTAWYVLERMRGRKALVRHALERASVLPMIANATRPMTTPVDELAEVQFGLLLYYRGPLMYETLRQEVGDEAFFAALRRWYADHIGEVVTRADWEATFLALLPEEERAAFARSWLDGDDDLLPASVASFLPEGKVAALRRRIAAMRPEPEPDDGEAGEADAADGAAEPGEP